MEFIKMYEAFNPNEMRNKLVTTSISKNQKMRDLQLKMQELAAKGDTLGVRYIQVQLDIIRKEIGISNDKMQLVSIKSQMEARKNK